MLPQITKLDNPIDVQLLMHKAFQALTERTQALAAKGQDGGDLDEFGESFGFWVKQLLFHATAEDQYMTAPLTDFQPARDNEAEHAELVWQGGELVEFLGKGNTAGLAKDVQRALALEEQQHQELVERVQEVEDALAVAIGERQVLARTRRHLYSKVTEMTNAELDHFENEEAFVCPIIGEKFSEEQQLSMVKALLIDPNDDDPRWIIDWVASELDPGEKEMLADLESKFMVAVERLGTGASSPSIGRGLR